MSVGHDPELPMPHQPGVMLIHLLNRCNLACQHCYLDAAPWRNTSLPLELVIRSFGEAASLGIATICLSGGEPFLYPGLPEALTFAAGQQSFQVHISTNGTLIGTAEAMLLKETGTKLQVSIDGPEAYHDEMRGLEGAFRRASRGIEQLVAAGVPVGIVTTISQDNLASLPWLAEWAAGMGVERISAQPLLRLGRGSQIEDKKLTEEQLCDLFLLLSDLGHTYRSQGLRFALAYRTRRLLAEHPCAAYVCDGAGCHRKVAKEIKKLVIREDGTVLPESPTLDYRFALGSLYEGTLEELTTHYFADGYAQFDRLCRTVYEEVMPTWTSPLIPWNEILSEHSWTFDIEEVPEPQ
jgi:MoaA/NifB/PqqE/SkfB family radical SAM enzyme